MGDGFITDGEQQIIGQCGHKCKLVQEAFVLEVGIPGQTLPIYVV